MTSGESEKYNLLNQLADEFAERYRRGERPSLQEYVERHAVLADEIRELFPAMIELEQAKKQGHDPQVSKPSPSLPSHVGDFRILREIGRGGMGIVYEAEQVSLGRHVALKVLTQNLQRDERPKLRFEREAKAAARLHHTNIVPVFGVGEHEGQPYYAMQFIQGLGLDKVLEELRRLGHEKNAASHRTGQPTPGEQGSAAAFAYSLLTGAYQPPLDDTVVAPSAVEANAPAQSAGSATDLLGFATSPLVLPGLSEESKKGRTGKPTYWQSVARIGAQVADALDYAHRQGVQHRDIKPSNLLMDVQGTVWVTDFGLAKTDDQQNLTHTGDILGTLRYMPPESFEGQSDARGDVYSLGLTLYELLTFRPAFREHDRIKLIKQVIAAEITRLRQLNTQIPSDLETIVHKAIEREPSHPYRTAGELAGDLQRFLDDEPIRARRIGALEQLGRWCRRNRTVASLVASVLTLFVLLALGAVVAAVSLQHKNVRAENAELEARKKTFDTLVAQAKAGRFSHRKGQRFETLQAIRDALELLPTLGLPEEEQTRTRDALRNLAIFALILPDMRIVREVPYSPDNTSYHEQISGERFLMGDKKGNIILYRADDRTELARLAGEGYPTGYTFNPLKQDLVWVYRQNGDGFRLLEWNPSTGHTRVLVEKTIGRDSADINHHRLTRWAVASNEKGLIEIRDVPSFRLVRILPVDKGKIRLALSPDGRQVAVVSGIYGQAERRQVRVYNVDTGEQVVELPQSNNVTGIEWTPDGQTLLVGCTDTGEIFFWDLATKKAVRVLNRQKGGEPHIVLNRTGDLLATTSRWGGGMRLWRARTGEQLLSIPETGMDAFRHFWGKNLLAAEHRSQDNRLEIWEINCGLEYRTLTHTSGVSPTEFESVSISPDGRIIAAGTDRGVAIWDMVRGEERAFLPINASSAWFEPASGALFTNGFAGLLRWPVVRETPTAIRIGPPQRWTAEGHFDSTVRGSRDGKTLAVSGWPDVSSKVFHLDQPPKPVLLGPLNGQRLLAVSPNGSWVVTSQDQPEVIVWDARTGQKIKTLTAEGGNFLAFSPNGRWLAIVSAGEVAVWEVDGWRELWKQRSTKKSLGKSVLFSPDSHLLAFETGQGAIRLVEPATGRDLALLEDPNQDRATYATFSPDGTQLTVASDDSQTIHVWDLRAIRRQLDELGLDWDTPPYPSAPDLPFDTPDPKPLQVQVDLGIFEEPALGSNPKAEQLVALIAYDSAKLLLNPSDFRAYRQRGRAYGYLSQLHGRKESARAAIADCSAAYAVRSADDPACIEVLACRGGQYLSLRQYPEVLADLRRIERLDPFCGTSLRLVFADRLTQLATDASQKNDHRETVALLHQALLIDPENLLAHNNLAWYLLAGPKEVRDADAGLKHARAAVALAPEQGIYLNTLGVALYRNKRYAEAISPLERSSQQDRSESYALDQLFLAMCHHRLGNAARANDCRKHAADWMRKHEADLPANEVSELNAFQSEADAVLAEPPGQAKQ